MRKISIIIILQILGLLTISAQYSSNSENYKKGKVIERLSLESEILNQDVNYSIYLPPDYDSSDRDYPVVYLLHGFNSDETVWVQYGEVNETADRGIANRKFPPMVIVMPDAKVSWYINDYLSKNRYEDMIFEEFIPYIEKTYKIRAKKEFRAVCGLSMGGYGSLIWSLHHPEMFSVCAPFSAGVFTDDEISHLSAKRYNRWFKDLYVPENSDQRLSQHYNNNSVLYLLKELPVEQIKQVDYFIHCGDDDFLFKGNSQMHWIMRERKIDHEYRVDDGSHRWVYWRDHIGEALEYIGTKFHGK